jgi:uncharacterized RDD family membrane protein YckC
VRTVEVMSTTLPPPTGPSLRNAFLPLQAPAGADPWRTLARPRSWFEIAPAVRPRRPRPATASSRLWAAVVDLFVYGGPVALAAGLAALVVPRDAEGLPANTKLAALVIATPVVVAAMVAFRLVRAVALDGSTVGRQAARIMVVRAGTDQPLGYGRTMVRTGTHVLVRLLLIVTAVAAIGPDGTSGLTLTAFVLAVLLNVLDAAWMLVDPRCQTLHDKAAGSMVVRD